jgi:hypothetical protein
MAALNPIQRLATWIAAALDGRWAFKAVLGLLLCLSLSLSIGPSPFFCPFLRF